MEMIEEIVDSTEFDKNILKLDSSFDTGEFVERIYGREMPEPIKPLEIGIDELPIGFTSPEFTDQNLVTIKIRLNEGTGTVLEPKARSIVVIGKEGTGKTVLSKILVVGMIKKFGMKCFAIDSYDRGELHKSRLPSFSESIYTDEYRERIDKHLARYGLKREGVNFFAIAPRFMGEEKQNVDKFYSLSYLDFKELYPYDSDSCVNILAELLGVPQNQANIVMLMSAMSNRKIESWAGLRRELMRLNPNVDVIFNSIDALRRNNALSDDIEYRVNIPELMSKYEMVSFRGKIRKDEDDTYFTRVYHAFLKLALAQIRVDLSRWLDSKDAACYLKLSNGIVVFAPEGDSLAPAIGKCSIRNYFINLALKERKTLISSVIDCQSGEKLDKSFIEQSDYIFTSKVEEENKLFLLHRGIPKHKIEDEMMKLKTEQSTSIDTKVSEFEVINIDKECTTLYPIEPTCAHQTGIG